MSNFLNNVINLSASILLGILIIKGWMWAHDKESGSKWAGVFTTLIFVATLGWGERFYTSHQTMPFLFGFGGIFDKRSDYLVLDFLLLLGLSITFLSGWGVKKGCAAYTESPKLPGTLKASFVGIIFSILLLVSAGAYHNKITHLQPATKTMSGAKELALSIIRFCTQTAEADTIITGPNTTTATSPAADANHDDKKTSEHPSNQKGNN